MDFKHNKKRNLGIVYNILILEYLESEKAQDQERKRKVAKILKKYFNEKSLLKRELQILEEVYEVYKLENPDKYFIGRVILESKVAYSGLDYNKIQRQKTNLILEMNKELGKSVWSRKIPNYKRLAMLGQILDPSLTIVQKTLLEESITKDVLEFKDKYVDLVDFKNIKLVADLVEKNFEDKYKNQLNEKQYKLIDYFTKYDLTDAELKVYLDEEISRIKFKIEDIIYDYEDKDREMVSLLKEAQNKIEEISQRELKEEDIENMLKIYSVLDRCK